MNNTTRNRPLEGVRIFLSLVALFCVSMPVCGRADDPVASSCADCVTVSGEFSVSNDTGTTIHYFVKWGEHAWKETVLPTGKVSTHRYPLDQNGKAPSPVVSFDPAGRVGRGKEYNVEIARVEGGGFSSSGPGPRGKPFPYKFIIHGRFLDLVKG